MEEEEKDLLINFINDLFEREYEFSVNIEDIGIEFLGGTLRLSGGIEIRVRFPKGD